MEAARIPWRPIGELFVNKGLITEEQLEKALAEQAATGSKLGEILVKRSLISSPELTQTLMEQLGCEVTKEEGFGSGLWSEIRRRHGRSDAEEDGPAGEKGRPPFAPVLSPDLGAPTEVGASPGDLDEQDFEELRLLVVQPPSVEEEQPEAEVAGTSLREAGLEIEALKSGLAERDRRVADLEAEVGLLRAAAQEPFDAGWAETEQLERDLAAAQAELGGKDERLQELDAIRHDLQERIAELERVVEESRADEEAAAGTEQDLAAARQELARAEEARTALAEQLAGLESALAVERDSHAETRQRLEETAAEAARAHEAVLEVERGFNAAQAERDTARSEAAANRDALVDREQRLAAHGDRVEAAEAALAAERQAHEETRRRLEEVGAEAAGAWQAREELERESQRVRGEREQLLAELESVRSSGGEAERARAELADRLAVADSVLAAERQAHEETRRRLEEVGAEAAGAWQAREELERELDHVRVGRDQALAELESVRGAQAELADRLASAESDLGAAGVLRSELEHQLAATDSRAVDLERQTSDLTERLSRAEASVAREREACQSARLDAETASGKLQDAGGRIGELTAALARLQDEHGEHSEALAGEIASLESRCQAAESRLVEQAARHSETRSVLSHALEELSGRSPSESGGGGEPPPDEYLCFIGGQDGYRVLERSGPLPGLGGECDVDGIVHVITRIGRSPFPFDARKCAYLLPVR
jgi:chromosome segregation ATPase